VSAKNVLAVIGAIALIVVFRTQLIQIINALNTMVTPR
jgi:hypothetical protein